MDVKITSVKNKVIIINIIFKPPDVSPGISKIQKEHWAGETTNPADHQPKICCATELNYYY